jgi:hypothetical protein
MVDVREELFPVSGNLCAKHPAQYDQDANNDTYDKHVILLCFTKPQTYTG